MLIINELICFFLVFSAVHCQRYYAFIETLFVIDRNYFPALSGISDDEYIKIMVDTTNIVKFDRPILVGEIGFLLDTSNTK